ncbi:hypothetical protein [Streptomyces lavendofoliae]|uniref:Secreted protein n=1 Tax=Streptomyces lavendofoliae TaxID=67314 RepID=A0A918M3U5_9ACTN|nr:hypothetical protein [Streptomyces lavendofoliae]GGU32036.1 hypothetical protein GCM10010274_18660 [Streptomyces lavendofoliae]
MSRRIALLLTGAALLFTALATPAAASTLPPINGPLADLQVEGPLFTSPLI